MTFIQVDYTFFLKEFYLARPFSIYKTGLNQVQILPKLVVYLYKWHTIIILLILDEIWVLNSYLTVFGGLSMTLEIGKLTITFTF